MSGKGCQYRRVDQKKFSENYDKIFEGSEVCEKCGYLKTKDRVCIRCWEKLMDVEDKL